MKKSPNQCAAASRRYAFAWVNRKRRRIRIALLIAARSALLPGALAAQAPSPTPDDFFQRGTPTFVLGTAGDEYRLIALVPARSADQDGPGYPEFLLYAGNGSPGVAEINGVRHGGESILVADAFGRLLTGSWQKTSSGTMVPVFPGPRARRIAWRTVKRELQTGAMTKPEVVHVRFPQRLPAAQDEELVNPGLLARSGPGGPETGRSQQRGAVHLRLP